MTLSTGCIFGWFWSIAIGLQEIIPEESKLNVGVYKIFLLIPVVYILILSWIFTTLFFCNPNIEVFAIIVPLHLFSMFCICYFVYFVAKVFKTAELQKKGVLVILQENSL